MHLHRSSFYGAGDEARTRYLHLGKVALYRMSYTRGEHDVLYQLFRKCQYLFRHFLIYFSEALIPLLSKKEDRFLSETVLRSG